MYTADQILAIVNFMGDTITREQSSDLMDEVRKLSIADQEYVHTHATHELYTELSMHNAEMGGLSRY